jgi:hypothetical protein
MVARAGDPAGGFTFPLSPSSFPLLVRGNQSYDKTVGVAPA